MKMSKQEKMLSNAIDKSNYGHLWFFKGRATLKSEILLILETSAQQKIQNEWVLRPLIDKIEKLT